MAKSVKKSKNSQQMMNREFTINTRKLDVERRQIELSFSSEEPYERWFGSEILSHEEGAADIERLKDIGCLLFNHKRDVVIGRIDDVWIENGRGYALVTFDDDDESEKYFRKVESGTLKGVSVGYRVSSWEEVSVNKVSANGKHIGPCHVALKWEPYEISIVSVPADPTVGIGRDLEDEDSINQETDYSFYEKQMQVTKNYLEVTQ